MCNQAVVGEPESFHFAGYGR